MPGSALGSGRPSADHAAEAQAVGEEKEGEERTGDWSEAGEEFGQARRIKRGKLPRPYFGTLKNELIIYTVEPN